MNFNLSGVVSAESSGKSLEGVKIDLIKNEEILESLVTSSNGKYKISWEVNNKDSSDADYKVSFSKDNMIPKSAKFNTYIREALASRYDFELSVNMTEVKEGEIIVDLPSAKINWDEKNQRFKIDQKYANIIKQIKQQDDPKKAQEMLERQRQEEDALKKKEENEKKKQLELERKAAEEQIRKNLEAIRKQQEELDKVAAMQKAYEDSIAKLAEDRSKKKSILGESKVEKGMQENKEVKIEVESQVETSEKSINNPASEDEDEFSINEIYSIRDAKLLRARNILYQNAFRNLKVKNSGKKYETVNPVTSLLDVIEEFEKSKSSLVKE